MNAITKAINSIPANRMIFYSVMSFMITFERLQFYYYHRQNLTESSTALLSNIDTMVQDRGQLPQTILENCDASICKLYMDLYNNLLVVLEKKQSYTDNFMKSRNPDGLGFFTNNLDFFFFELPVAFLLYGIFALIFRLLFNYRISKYLRKYSFYGIFLFLVYEGNVEQFAFYFFTECRNLFSANFSHKIANVVIVYFFFLMVVFSVGGLLFFTFNYRKLVKYFLEDSKESNIEAVVIESLERSIYPLVFGCTHALFIDNLALQTIVLAMVELSYFLSKVYALRSVTPTYKFKVCMLLTTSFLRLIFITTFYIYEEQGNPVIINLLHYDLVWVYLICWLVELFHDVVVFVSEVYEAVKTTVFETKKVYKKEGITNRKRNVDSHNVNKVVKRNGVD